MAQSVLEHTLLLVIVQLLLVIASARIFATVFKRLGQPQVCGEIAAGLVLGPSLLGGLFPQTFKVIFDPSVAGVFTMLSQVGLILLMFIIGLEFDFGHLAKYRHVAVSVSLAGIVLPFSLGLLLSELLYPYAPQSVPRLYFSLFMGTAMSITAIPVLGRIMLELKINRTRYGTITITAAAIDDACGWIILALVSAVVRAQASPALAARIIAEAAGFALFMYLVTRPILKRWTRSMMKKNAGELSLNHLAAILMIMFVAAAITNLIGIFSVFGGFMVGAILFDEHEFRLAVERRLNDFVVVFFLPIFFTFTGLRTNVGTLHGARMWLLCGLVLLAACLGKFGGATSAARLCGIGWRESCAIGVMMNTRGLMELVAINIGYELGVIPPSIFCMLVIMAVATTYMTAPILRRLMHLKGERPRAEAAGGVPELSVRASG